MRKGLIAAVIVMAAAGYAWMLGGHLSRAAAGADASGYLNEARLIAAGRMSISNEPLRRLGLDESWAETFSPLGFVPAVASRTTLVPVYPPGVPLHLAAAAMIGGWTTAPFLVGPLAAFGCLALTFVLARMLGLPPLRSLGAAAMLAAFPTFIFIAVGAMSDVVATFWTLAAIVCALCAQRTPWFAPASGAAFAMAVAVRPSNALLVLPLVFALGWNRRNLLLGAGGALPLALALMAWNSALYGSVWRTGYGNVLNLMAWSYGPEGAAHYAFWLAALLTPLVFPAGLLIAFDRRAAPWTRAVLVSWFSGFFLFYCFVGLYGMGWWATRYLLPAVPPLLVGALLLVRGMRGETALAALLIALCVLNGALQTKHRHVLRIGDNEAVYPEAVTMARRKTPPNAMIVAMQTSGALLYYDGRLAVRWDMLDPARFARLRAAAGTAPWFALVADFERDDVRRRLPGNWLLIDQRRGIGLWRYEQ
jgi:4-amino-4-deoxy-L-arabinose transferase-like glycosyltransferase